MRRQLLIYGVAIGSTAIALGLTLILEPFLAQSLSTLFFVAIAITTWYGGLKPGLVAVIVSTLSINEFFIPPLGQFTDLTVSDLIRLLSFALVAVVIHGLSAHLKISQHQIEQLNRRRLAESRDRLQTALNAAQMGMWDWDMVANQIQWSPEHEQLLGLSPGSFDGRYQTFDDRVHPEDKDTLNQVITEALQNHKPYHHEFRVIWPDGSIHWVEGRGHGFYDTTGQAVRMSGTIMAIDDRKQAQLLLQQQLEQQRLIMEISQRIRQSLQLSEILQTTVDEVRQFLQCDRTIILQFSPDWGGRVIVESVSDPALAIFPLNIYDPCIGENYIEPFQQGLVTAKADIYTADISPCHVQFLAQFQVRANLVVPILKHQQLWGLLAAHHCTAPRPWQTVEIDLLKQISAQVSIAIQQSTLLEQVQIELIERIQAEQALQKLNLELEQRVAERTTELIQLNNRLLTTLKEQQQAQTILAEQAQLLDLAHDTIITLDLDWVITFWNHGAEVMYGWSSAEALGKQSHQLLKTEFPDALTTIKAQLLAQGYWEGELHHITRSGHSIIVASRWVLQTNSDQQPSKILEINNDITARKQAELALQQYTNEIEDLYHNAPCGYHSLDAQGMIVRINNTELNWLGYTRDQIINKKRFLDLLAPESKQIFLEEFPRFTQRGSVNNLEFHMVKKDGSTCWFSLNATAIKDEQGNFLMSRSTLFNINDRKQVEFALQQQTRQKQLLWNIAQTIRQSLEINIILNGAVTEVRQLLDLDRVAIYQFNADWSGDFIVEAVTENWVKLVEPNICKIWEDTYLQETQGGRFRDYETLVVNDIYQAGLQPCHIQLLEQFQAKAYAIAPIFVGTSLWGLLALYQNATPHIWTAWEVELLQQIANQLAIAIQQSQLYSQLQTELQERQQATAILREAERRWRSLLDNLSSG